MTGQLRANWIRQIRSQSGGTISLLVLAIGGGALALALAAEWAGLRFNDSPSMPTGLYVRTSSDRIIHMLETGVAPWQKPWNPADAWLEPRHLVRPSSAAVLHFRR